MEMITKENAIGLEALSKAIKESKQTILEATEKVEKLHEEVSKFMDEFRRSSDSNTEAMNKVIAGFRSFVQAEKVARSLVRSEIKLDNAELNASIVSKIENLQSNLAIKKTSWINWQKRHKRPGFFQ